MIGVLVGLFSLVFAGATLSETCVIPEHDITLLPKVGEAPVDVGIELYLNDITAINDENESFTADVFIRAEWRDRRLVHNGLAPCTTEQDQIWTPSLHLLNRRDLEKLSPPELSVMPDGRVIQRMRGYGDFTFRENLEDFPFDQQIVHFTLIAGYSPKDIHFVAPRDKVGMADQMSVSNWDIRPGKNRLGEYYIAPLKQHLSRLDVEFLAERKTGYYTWQLMVPLVLVGMMTWVVFWIPLEFVAPRVGLVATSMLTLIAFRFSMAKVLPPIAYLTRLDVFMVASSILVFSALAAVVAVTYLEGRGKVSRAERFNLVCRWVVPLLFLLVITRVLFMI